MGGPERGTKRRPRTAIVKAAAETAGKYRVSTGIAELVRDSSREQAWTLLLDGVPSSYVDLDDPTNLDFEYLHWFAAVVDALAPAGRAIDVVHLGGGAATLARYVSATHPGSRQVVFEVDEELVALVRRLLPVADRGIRYRVADARAGAAKLSDASYDLVVRDAFSGTTVPGHLRTLQSMQEVARLLRPGGAYLLNIPDRAPFAAVGAEVAAMLPVFEHLVLVSEPGVLRGRRYGNLVLVASRTELPAARIARSVTDGGVQGRIRQYDSVRYLARNSTPLLDSDLDAIAAPAGNV